MIAMLICEEMGDMDRKGLFLRTIASRLANLYASKNK